MNLKEKGSDSILRLATVRTQVYAPEEQPVYSKAI